MKPISNCRACGSERLTEFLDLDDQYLSDFRRDDQKPPKYPLVAVFCEECKLVQLKHTTPQPEMYHDRYGFKSGVSQSIRDDLADNVRHAHEYVPYPRTWLDIACNDGTLLSYVPKDIVRVGVDPVTFLSEEARQHATVVLNSFFDANEFAYYEAGDGRKTYSRFDVITSISCFYDMPDPNKFVSDVRKVLDSKGVWVVQQNYLLTTIELSAVDNFCHEHLEYYTLMSLENLLEKHGLEVNEVLLSPVNGGSIRTIISHRGTFPIHRSVELQRIKEKEAGLDNIEAYVDFASRVTVELDKLKSLVERLKRNGKSIYILAASTRGATIWQSAGIDSKQITYAVERNPAKVGSNFSALGIPIISEEQARKYRPDYMIVGPWFFKDEIVKREKEYLAKGGKFIVPLPKVDIIDKHNL